MSETAYEFNSEIRLNIKQYFLFNLFIALNLFHILIHTMFIDIYISLLFYIVDIFWRYQMFEIKVIRFYSVNYKCVLNNVLWYSGILSKMGGRK